MKSICVIGAGASGLCSIKSCLEENFNVVCYEQSNHIGGLWKYREQQDGLACVAKTTIINSSKEITAYSDFPMPAESPNYLHNKDMLAYYEHYADHFNLRPYIKFQYKVIKCELIQDDRAQDYWQVTALDLETREKVVSVFDGIMVCTGHHNKPLIPKFKGQDKFKGKIIHSQFYKKPQPFEDQRVAIIGIGNSGCDAAVELSMFTDKCYLSARHGAWFMSRVDFGGLPMDYNWLRRRIFDAVSLFGVKASSFLLEFFANLRFNHSLYKLKPQHRVFGQHPTVNDVLPNRILSGTVILKNSIKEFTEDGVIFEGDNNKVTKVDVVILATGYEICFPFLDNSLIWSKTGRIQLFKYVFSPNLRKPHTLAIIGLIQPYGPLVPISESQARWFAQLMSGKIMLPSKEEMLRNIHQTQQKHDKLYYSSPRHMIQIEYCHFMDEIAQQYGAKPNLWKLFFTDPVLWYSIYFGAFVAYQFRLQGPHPWSGAREAILKVDERVKTPFKTRCLDGSINKRRNSFHDSEC